MWEGFGSRGVTGVTSVRKAQKLPHVRQKTVAVSSERDLLLAELTPQAMLVVPLGEHI